MDCLPSTSSPKDETPNELRTLKRPQPTSTFCQKCFFHNNNQITDSSNHQCPFFNCLCPFCSNKINNDNGPKKRQKVVESNNDEIPAKFDQELLLAMCKQLATLNATESDTKTEPTLISTNASNEISTSSIFSNSSTINNNSLSTNQSLPNNSLLSMINTLQSLVHSSNSNVVEPQTSNQLPSTSSNLSQTTRIPSLNYLSVSTNMESNFISSNHLSPNQFGMSTPATSPTIVTNTSTSDNSFNSQIQCLLTEGSARLAFGAIILLELGRRVSGICEPSILASKHLPQINLTEMPANMYDLIKKDLERLASPLLPQETTNDRKMKHNDSEMPFSQPKIINNNDLCTQIYRQVLQQILNSYEQQIEEFICQSVLGQTHPLEVQNFIHSVPTFKNSNKVKKKVGRKPKQETIYENF